VTTDPRHPDDKSLARSLGEFVGHIVHGIKAAPKQDRKVLRKDVQEAKQGDVTLRRTTIDEVEFKDGDRT
jgi:hypothetical protein